jgi:Ca-activated chloride channel family protein
MRHAPLPVVPLAVAFIIFCALPSAAEDADRKRLELVERALADLPEDAGARTLSPYFFVGPEDAGLDALPLKAVEAEARLVGAIAHVRLTQVYQNQGEQDLEAIYLFPASTRAAVHRMRMRVGAREIEAQIKKRAEARDDYEQALAEGRTASLLEQERPNVFQMSVGHILPGDEVRVVLDYTELLTPEDGQYEFVLPAVVGPRYSNQPASEARAARWVENPYLRAGERPPYTFALKVELESGVPIARVTSPSHPVRIEYHGANSACLELQDERAGDRDLVLRYALAGGVIEQGLLLYPGEAPGEEGFFALAVEPPVRVEAASVVPREYLFIVDVSGSMHGFPLETARALMERLLNGLRSDERFNILTFSGGSDAFGARPQEATRKNVRRALEWLGRYDGGGGTELLAALARALEMPRAEGASRVVVVITDGYVVVEREAFELVAARLGEANLFAFGIGASVNRFLIEGLARAGQGEPFVVLGPQEAEARAQRFAEYVSQPVLSGIQVAFEGFEAHDLEPPAVPDLFARRPVLVTGKYRGPAQGRVKVTGRTSAGPFEARLEVAEARASCELEALRILWARQRIARLSDLVRVGRDPARVEEVTGLGLAYNLLTEFTSFVAVDTEVRADGQRVTRVRQPLPLPSGVSDRAVGGLGMLGKGSGGGGLGTSGGFGGLGTRGAGVPGGGRRASVVHRSACLVTGSLDRSVIQRVIRAEQGRVKALYERRLQQDPKLKGKIVLELTIGPDGKVVKARVVEDTLRDTPLAGDLEALARRWVFPPIPGGGQVVVRYPFVFHPGT